MFKRKVFLFLILSCLCSCEYYLSIDMRNDFKDCILVYVALGTSPDCPTSYPDSLLPAEKYNLYKIGDKLSDYLIDIKPNSTNSLWSCISYNDDTSTCLREAMSSDTLSVFIIHADTLNKYGYDMIASENRIMIRYDFSIKDLQELNYKITFPPSPLMKNIKMYPPYETVIGKLE